MGQDEDRQDQFLAHHPQDLHPLPAVLYMTCYSCAKKGRCRVSLTQKFEYGIPRK